ncbi:hypothetical protein SDC9_75445 [bioreactor metagenome]|uniref:CarD-like/TRCF RNAP-interacting domain-containing protein n=1 Tax=bioreactor metagenome TaxID=1076179 RepID=A0A644YLN7_9ZZZZ
MFIKDDLVVYGSEGVCRVTNISTRKFGNADREYYILVPVNDVKSTIYVPVGNKKLEFKMHKVLSSIEINELISCMPQQEGLWIDNEILRKQKYQDILRNGKHLELISLIKAVHSQQEKLKITGKKLHQSDAKFLAEAQKMLHGEFSAALNIEIDEVIPFIMKKLSMS